MTAEEPVIQPPEDVPPVSAEALVEGEATQEGDRRYPSTIGGAFYLLFLAVIGAGIAVAVYGEWRTGVQIIGGSLIASALVRLLLRSSDAGMLAVRNRWIDASLLVVLGGAMIFLAGSIPDQPGV